MIQNILNLNKDLFCYSLYFLSLQFFKFYPKLCRFFIIFKLISFDPKFSFPCTVRGMALPRVRLHSEFCVFCFLSALRAHRLSKNIKCDLSKYNMRSFPPKKKKKKNQKNVGKKIVIFSCVFNSFFFKKGKKASGTLFFL